MKNKIFKHVLAAMLAVCMIVTMLPASVFAATLVTPVPDDRGDNNGENSGQLPVEYFNSTFYLWDQREANKATLEANTFTTEGWVNKQDGNINWSDLGTSNTPVNTGYYVQLSDGEYYPAYASRSSTSTSNTNRTYTLYYRINSQNMRIDTYIGNTTNAGRYYPDEDIDNMGVTMVNGMVALYKFESATVYENKGFYFTEKEYRDMVPAEALPAHGQWSDAKEGSLYKQNYYIYSGLAARKLSESTTAPFNPNTIIAADLFGEAPTAWKDVYTDVRVPYIYDAETGYYTLSSDANGVYFEDGEGQSGATMLIADKPSGFQYRHNNLGPATAFQPFEKLSNIIKNARLSGGEDDPTAIVEAYMIEDDKNKANTDGTDATFGFGMVTQVNFQMTDDGKSPVNGEDIVFTFSGDDDVWVYIDGILVLDIGGTHDAVTGVINFATGDVTLSSRYGKLGDRAVDKDMNGKVDANNANYDINGTLSQANIYSQDCLNKTLIQFASEGKHTMTIYYMDRGEGRTNCLIQFNLPQRDTVEVTKKFDSSKSDAGEIDPIDTDELESYGGREFGFTLYENGKAVANKTYYVYDSNNRLLRSASTNAAGHFTLRRNETARFLVDIGEDDSFYVIEDEMTVEVDGFLEPSWTYSTNITGATADARTVEGFRGMTVTATGSDTTTDTISFICENYLSANVPNPGILTQNDRIVIDYGLPISINVSDLLKNDIIRGENVTVELIGNGGEYGTAVYNNKGTADVSDDTITYTLNKQFTGIETLTYSVTVTGTGNEGSETTIATATGTGNVLIMPATSMYYEENFSNMVTYSNGAVQWVPQGTAMTDNQETGIVGTVGDSTYGSDKVYLNNLGDSYGTSMLADATKEIGKGAQFEYDFTGTGTAIYGRISTETGYIQVTVTGKDTENVYYIDTSVIANVGSDTELYNIPIFYQDGLEYGEYHVKVYLYKEGTPTAKGLSGAEFYLDGIRVYDPVVGNTTVNTAYADDGEANTAVLNIRDKVLADDDKGWLDDIFTLTDQYGNVIYGEDGDEVDNIADYADYGPNHELYLNGNLYSVSFKLINWNSQYYKLYLGMKAPNGTAATVSINGTEIELNNSADCYYDISNYVTVETVDGVSVGTVTVKGSEDLVSLTNIKVTGIDSFDLGYSDDITNEGDEIVVRSDTLYLVPATFSLRGSVEEVPGETEPEETVPEEPKPEEPKPEKPEKPGKPKPEETFKPMLVLPVCTYSRLLRIATITLTTSRDVAYVTINGVRVNMVNVLGVNVCVYSAVKVNRGTTFEIVFYNAAGVASQAYTWTAK